MQGWLIVPLVPVQTRGQRPALPALNTSISYVDGELLFCIHLHCIFSSFLFSVVMALVMLWLFSESKQTGNSSRGREHSVTQSHKVRITQPPHPSTASLLSQLARDLANDCIFPLKDTHGFWILAYPFPAVNIELIQQSKSDNRTGPADRSILVSAGLLITNGSAYYS